jgi:signal peptidase I
MKEEKSGFLKFVEAIKPYAIIVAVVVLIRTFIVTPGIVNGESMEDTLFEGDFVLVNKIGLYFGIDRFDIVVVKYDNDTIIKRVIGLPGETVKYADNVLYVDGKKVITPIEFEATDDFTLKAGSDEYIVLGDNRNISKDSRVIGPVNRSKIKGKVRFVLFPFKDFGVIK